MTTSLAPDGPRTQSVGKPRNTWVCVMGERLGERAIVVGVSLRDGEELHADLVVDASGRNSVTAQWLPALGFQQAPETYVNFDVHDASRVVQPAICPQCSACSPPLITSRV